MSAEYVRTMKPWSVAHLAISILILNCLFSYAVGESTAPACNRTIAQEPAGETREIYCKCRCNAKKKEFFSEISWKPPLPGKQPVVGYRLVFYQEGQPELHECFKVSKDTKTFRFNKTTGHGVDYYSYAVIAEPVSSDTPEYEEYLYCPDHMVVEPINLQRVVINVGENATYKCSFKSKEANTVIKADNVTWKFLPVDSDKDVRILRGDKHVKIRNDESSSTLTITKALKSHEGTYSCEGSSYCHGSASAKGGLLQVTRKSKKKRDTLGPLIGGVTGGILLLVFLFLFLFVKCKKPPPRVIFGMSFVQEQRLYISHCTDDETELKKLVKFGSHLKSMCSNITVVADFLCETQINNAGGMSQWIPDEMAKADKILLVLSGNYLQQCKLFAGNNLQQCDRDIESTRKIRAEYGYLESLLHSNLQITDKLIIVSDGVKIEEFPDILKGRSHFPFPKDTGKDASDENMRQILSVLSGETI